MNTTIAPTGAALSEQIAELTRGIAQLDRTREDHVQELGRKLIPIRQLLQTVNGVARPYNTGRDGLSPRGWGAWLSAAGIAQSTSVDAINRAVDPQGSIVKSSSRMREGRRKSTSTIRGLRQAWPNWTNEDRAKVIATVRELAMESNRGA